MKRISNYFEKHKLKREYRRERKYIFEILSNNLCNSQDIKEIVEKKILRNGIRRYSYKTISEISSRIDNALSYLLKNRLIDFRNNSYYLTDDGKAEIHKVKNRESKSFLWIKRFTGAKSVTFMFISGSFLLTLIKITDFSLTGNLILLTDSLSSFFGVVTIIMISISSKIKYEKLITRIIQLGFIIVGIAFLIIGIDRIINPIEATNFNNTITTVIIVIIIGGILFLYLYIGGLLNNDIETKVYTEKMKGDVFLFLVLMPSISKYFGLAFFEGLIVLFYGFIIMSEAV